MPFLFSHPVDSRFSSLIQHERLDLLWEELLSFFKDEFDRLEKHTVALKNVVQGHSWLTISILFSLFRYTVVS